MSELFFDAPPTNDGLCKPTAKIGFKKQNSRLWREVAYRSKMLKKKPFLLNIESATGVCSVGVSHGPDLLALEEAGEVFQHAKVLTRLIEQALKKSGKSLHDMEAVAVSAGPGSYTSLRVGAATAKGICYALGKPLIAVDTLEALARAARKEVGNKKALYCPMIDARRMEVYCNVFDAQGRPMRRAEAKVVTKGAFDSYFNADQTVVFTGNGAAKCEAVLSSPRAAFLPLECSAAFMPALSLSRFLEGQFDDVAYFTPRYLKPPNITVPKKGRGVKMGKIQ